MKKKIILLGLALSASSVFGATAYNTNITNQATLSFEVGGVSQADITSNTDEFLVDRKVDMTVHTNDSNNVVVNPSDNVASDTRPLSFTLTNNTNGRQDFALSLFQRASGTISLNGGPVDTIDLSTDLKVCLTTNCSGGAVSSVSLAAEGDTVLLYVFADIVGNPTPVNGDVAGIELMATAVADGTTTPLVESTGADNKTAVDIVFADGAGTNVSGDGTRDGKYVAYSAYQIESAVLALAKDSCVVSDPMNGTTNPKRIPGAIVRYTFNVNNAGNFEATNVNVTDTLNSSLTFGPGIAEIRDAACNCLNPAGATTTGTVTASGQDVTAAFGTIPASSTRTDTCAYFDVTIQ